jgi:pyridoxamine 5'-phosphate oxidase
MARSISDLRQDYTLSELRERDLNPNPFIQFEKWFQDATAIKEKNFEPNAMTLATATKSGVPSARIVLLKGFSEKGFIFYSNYESRKAGELAENPQAALCFHWAVLERQVCIMGKVEKVSREESEAYFKSRPIGSRLGAWASQQSAVIPNRDVLTKKATALETQYADGDVPLPPFWGGYRLAANEIQFWQGQTSRLHDRFRYLKQLDGHWIIDRLSP